MFASYTPVCTQVNNGARGGSFGGLPQISMFSMTMAQHTVLELGALLGPCIHSRVHSATQRFSGAHPLLALSFSLCRAPLQEERLGEPSEPRVAHSSGVRWLRLPGSRICRLLSPIRASVSSPVQWGRSGGCCGDPASFRVCEMASVYRPSVSAAPVMGAFGTPHCSREGPASCGVLADSRSLPRDKLSLVTHPSWLGHPKQDSPLASL